MSPMPILIFFLEERNRCPELKKNTFVQKNIVPHFFSGHFLRVEKNILYFAITYKLLIFLQFFACNGFPDPKNLPIPNLKAVAYQIMDLLTKN